MANQGTNIIWHIRMYLCQSYILNITVYLQYIKLIQYVCNFEFNIT